MLLTSPALLRADTAHFSNTQPIVTSGIDASAATPYASTITVTGLENHTILKVTVSLHGLTHSFPDDLDVLLVGPGGQRVMLMSDVGLDVDVNGLALTFDDAAISALPDTDALVSGTYHPGNSGAIADAFAPPAPAAPYAGNLAVFNGTHANGMWSLYVMDDTPEDGGAVSEGWSLILETAPAPAVGLASGTYQTIPGAIAVESGGQVPNGSRVVSLTATLTFDLSATPPSMTAVMDDAVLEGSDPFPLTVRSSLGARMADGTYRFTGDYLAEANPSIPGYFFNWTFSASSEGDVLWNGLTDWSGGHLWYVGITNVTLVSRPKLGITREGSQITITWPGTGYQLQGAASLPASSWDNVTNAVDITNTGSSVTLEATGAQRYFRLRKP
jgi:subtilisin-like proprotein convertase family protein